MAAVTLKAHFNGQQIVLDEPFDLPANSSLIVTVLPNAVSAENVRWHDASLQGLANAYGLEEPEYSASDIKP